MNEYLVFFQPVLCLVWFCFFGGMALSLGWYSGAILLEWLFSNG